MIVKPEIPKKLTANNRIKSKRPVTNFIKVGFIEANRLVG